MSPLPPAPKTARTGRRAVFLLLGLTLLLSVPTLHEFFSQQTMSIKVIHNDAPPTCRSKRSRWKGPKERSWKPQHSAPFYCGGIHTDIGFFHLPPSMRFKLIGIARENLQPRLTETCRFKVRVIAGHNGLPSPGTSGNMGNPTIIRIQQTYPCSPDADT